MRESFSQDEDALYELKASYNSLAADETKRFMNRGDWPKGWPEDEKSPLKPEYAEYRLK